MLRRSRPFFPATKDDPHPLVGESPLSCLGLFPFGQLRLVECICPSIFADGKARILVKRLANKLGAGPATADDFLFSTLPRQGRDPGGTLK